MDGVNEPKAEARCKSVQIQSKVASLIGAKLAFDSIAGMGPTFACNPPTVFLFVNSECND